jgi:predicted AlkP superfamily pyrophosphatase or phosphodiesterase
LNPILLLALLPLAACFAPRYIRSDGAVRVPARTHSGLTEHVVLISIDGLRPDAIAQFGAPTLSRLMREGSYTLSASTIFPSKTLPSHTSMLTGQPPAIHGILYNNRFPFRTQSARSPTIFGVLRSEGLVTAAFFSKAKFATLQQPQSLDYSQAPGGWWGHWSADRTAQDVERYLSEERPNLTFIHFGDTDRAGHDSGWMSPKYGAAVRLIDASIGRIVEAAQRAFGTGNFTMIVTSDHGGHDRDHGSADPRDVTIPWIAWGRGVKPGPLSEAVKTMDTASTVLWLFKVSEPTDWAGLPAAAAFQSRQD